MKKIKIMIADDESKLRTLIKDWLNDAGYEVVEAEDGKVALEKFEQDADIKLIWTVGRSARKSEKNLLFQSLCLLPEAKKWMSWKVLKKVQTIISPSPFHYLYCSQEFGRVLKWILPQAM